LIALRSSQGLGGFQDLVGAGADAEVAGEIDPTDGPGGIDEELGGTGDIVPVNAGAFVKEIVAADYFGVRVGEERVGVAGLAAEILGLAGGIDADGHGLDAELLKIGETLLYTP
jgi:hypothetical protein